MALRMIVAWMALVAIVVFVALVVEIITTSHQVTVGDIVTDHPNCSQVHDRYSGHTLLLCMTFVRPLYLHPSLCQLMK